MERVLFQLNLACMRLPFSDPIWDDFKAQLHSLHEMAKRHPGFVWRYQGEKDDLGYIAPYKHQPLIMGNFSAWRDYDSLYKFTFTDGHLEIMKGKRKWFSRLTPPYTVLYYGEESDLTLPGTELLEIAKQKLRYLSVYGESPAAFGFGPHQGKL